MMELFNSLLKTGSSVKPITDASQIQVKPISTGVDLVGMHERAGEKVASGFKKDVAKDNQLQGLLGAMAVGGVNALGGGSGESSAAPLQPEWVRGGSYFERPQGNLSSLQMAGKLGGLLNGSN